MFHQSATMSGERENYTLNVRRAEQTPQETMAIPEISKPRPSLSKCQRDLNTREQNILEWKKAQAESDHAKKSLDLRYKVDTFLP